MGSYVYELAPKIEGVGIRKISLLIEHSLGTKSVYFEIYENQGEWYLYWNFETSLSIIKQGAMKNGNLKLTFADVLENEIVLRDIHQLCKVYKCALTDEDVLVVKQFLMTQLPEIEKKPQGLDGHSYTIKVDEQDKVFKCWCVIPKDWIRLKKLIEMVVKKADLTDVYLISGIM